MAGDWIKMRADLFTHPKVFKIAEILGKDELYTVGALFCFWAWADKHCVDGVVDGATSRLIDRATRVDGLADALIAAGWLQIDDDGAHIPRFTEHNGDTAKERSLKNQRQARWRAGKGSGNVDGEASTTPSTEASTREEKRREEIDTSLRSVSSEPKPRALRKCPESFVVTDDLVTWAVQKTGLPAISIEAETEKFRDHTFKTAISDWAGAWRNWMRNAMNFAPKQQTSETAYQRSMREKYEKVAPAIAAKAPGQQPTPVVFDFEAIDAKPITAIGMD